MVPGLETVNTWFRCITSNLMASATHFDHATIRSIAHQSVANIR
ncbi:MAG: hypothetical protein ACOH2K_15840 [Burkholderiaceae bacterium]